jgi:hypothetical protein
MKQIRMRAFLLSLLAMAVPARAAPTDNLPPLADTPRPYKYVGNSFSHKFHRPGCPFARQMWSQRQVFFHYRCQAIEDKYLPCRYCLPPVWLSVRAKILPGHQGDVLQP